MKGDLVITRTFGDAPVVCRVAEDVDGVVYVYSPAQYDLWASGLPALEPVGFPASDVFQYDEAAICGNTDWSSLRPYTQ